MFFSHKSASSTNAESVQQILAAFFDLPAQAVSSWFSLDDNKLQITLPFAASSQIAPLTEKLRVQLSAQSKKALDIQISQKVLAAPTLVNRLPTISNIIAVASGKGGVGKSTTSINLAFALLAEGASVGILDADIYGPSVPIMLGNAEQKPATQDNQRVEPHSAHGLVATSIGYFVPAENATVWRGPMASRALTQLLNETRWPSLDYLIVDMPPGTGDIQLTLAQQVPVSGAVIVTTPQDLALADASKGIAMFNKVKVPVLGIVENMSYHVCRQCGHHEAIFAEHGGEKLAAQYQVPLLASLPLNSDIRQHADGGNPLALSQPAHPLTEMYQQLARQTAKRLYLNSLQ